MISIFIPTIHFFHNIIKNITNKIKKEISHWWEAPTRLDILNWRVSEACAVLTTI